MGSLFKAKTKATKSPFESNPWEPQQEFLRDGFGEGREALGGALANNAGIKDFVADLNPTQMGAIQQMAGLGQGDFQSTGQNFQNIGNGMVGDMSRASGVVNDYADVAGTDRTADIIARGGQYADNPYMQAQIDGAIKDVNRGFQRDQGGINAAATGMGGINSTRAGVMEALALDDAMDRSANISSGMRSNAYERGMDRSMVQDQAGMAERLAAAGALQQSGGMGADMATQGLGMRDAGNQMALGAGGILQGQAQNEIEGKRQMSREEMDLIKQYMGIVGGNYGSKGYQTTVTKSPSIFQQVAGATASIMGAM
jgi:hypothetical protein